MPKQRPWALDFSRLKNKRISEFKPSRLAKLNPSQLTVFIVVFATIGAVTLLLAIHALTPGVSIEPENGAFNGPAFTCSDASTNGSCVQFNSYSDLGYINVREAPYNAAGNGTTDDTHAIQTAMDDAFTAGKAVYIPSGTYLVSGTLNMHNSNYYTNPNGTTTCVNTTNTCPFDNVKRPGYQIIGSRQGSVPIIKLADGAAGFSNSNPTPGNYKPVFQAWLCTQSKVNPLNTCAGNTPNQNYTQIIRNLEINLGNGNNEAVGIEMRSAEGSGIGNVKIDAGGTNPPTTQALAGIYDLPGSGGSVEDLTVNGGQYGIYAPDAQPSPMVAGLTLSGQTTNAVYYGGSGPLTIVGFNISGAPSPAVAGLALTGSGDDHQEGASNLDLIDGSLSFANGNSNHIIEHSDRNLYVRNLYANKYNCISWNLATTPNSCDAANSTTTNWVHINEYVRSKNYPNNVRLINGNYEPNTTITLNLDPTSNPTPPADLVGRHVVTNQLPSFTDPGVINVKDPPYNAKGDGSSDDTVAIQNALNTGGSVFLPAGIYRISSTLTLKANSKLFGVTHAQTVIATTTGPSGWSSTVGAKTKVGVDSSGKSIYDCNQQTAMITTVNDPNASSILSDIKIELPHSGTCINGINWQAGSKSIVHYPWVIPEDFKDGGANNESLQRITITNNGGGRWYNVWGEVGFDTINPDSRFLKVQDTGQNAQALAFYALHGQYQQSDANIEFNNASNITVYGFKSENLLPPTSTAAPPALILINNSKNIGVFGHLSDATMNSGDAFITVKNSSDLLFTNIARFENGTATMTDGGDWYYVLDSETGKPDASITAQTNASLFRSGSYSYVAP